MTCDINSETSGYITLHLFLLFLQTGGTACKLTTALMYASTSNSGTVLVVARYAMNIWTCHGCGPHRLSCITMWGGGGGGVSPERRVVEVRPNTAFMFGLTWRLWFLISLTGFVLVAYYFGKIAPAVFRACSLVFGCRRRNCWTDGSLSWASITRLSLPLSLPPSRVEPNIRRIVATLTPVQAAYVRKAEALLRCSLSRPGS